MTELLKPPAHIDWPQHGRAGATGTPPRLFVDEQAMFALYVQSHH